MDMTNEQHEPFPVIDIDLDMIEHQAIRLGENAENFMDKVMDEYKTRLPEKRQKVLALKDTIKEKQQQVEKLKQDIKYYSAERKEIKALEEKTKSLQVTLERIREGQELAKQKAAHQKQVSIAVDTVLDLCKKFTGLVYYPVKENCLKFDFTLIDKDHPDKIFTITLHMIDEERIYEVEECDPMIPNLDKLVKNLNRHYDPSLFIKLIRREFCDLVSSSSSLTTTTTSSKPSSSSTPPPPLPKSPSPSPKSPSTTSSPPSLPATS